MEPMNLRIGEKLKSIRMARTLSLDDTAVLTGVSKPMLGQIERGQSIPTVTTLWKIATGLKTPLSAFLEEPQTEYTVTGPDEAKVVLGDRPVEVSERQAIRFRADIPHAYQNVTGDRCEVYNTIFYPHHYGGRRLCMN